MWSNNQKDKNGGYVSIGFATDIGNVRERNEDSLWFASDEEEAICMVADGVGGSQGGEFASAAAVKAAERYWKKSQGLSGLKRIFEEAHAEIRSFVQETKKKAGSTLSVLFCKGDEYSVAHAGDSRVYRVSKKPFAKIELLTQDDTWVAKRVREGVITAQAAADHPKRHTLTNCLGGFKDCGVFEKTGRIDVNDVFLLCTDGLYNYVGEAELKNVLGKCVQAQKTTDELLRLALSRGGKDNISVIVAKF